MDKARIEQEATRIQKEIWKHRLTLLGRDPVDPLHAIEPALAARIVGVDYEELEELGRFGDARGRFEIAGMLDRPRNMIAVACKFGPQVRRFTGAHEIAHKLMHAGEMMHRDLPISGMAQDSQPRKPIERQADYFAACFLIPEKLLRKVFKQNFGTTGGFVFDDTAAFWLSPGDQEALLYVGGKSLDRALALARAPSYGGRRIAKLTAFFKVSPTSMAIRIEELGLIRH